MQSDFIPHTPGVVCKESTESFVQELRELEVGHQVAGKIEHSRYNPPQNDYAM